MNDTTTSVFQQPEHQYLAPNGIPQPGSFFMNQQPSQPNGIDVIERVIDQRGNKTAAPGVEPAERPRPLRKESTMNNLIAIKPDLEHRVRTLLARIRHKQLETAQAGRILDSARYAARAQRIRSQTHQREARHF